MTRTARLLAPLRRWGPAEFAEPAAPQEAAAAAPSHPPADPQGLSADLSGLQLDNQMDADTYVTERDRFQASLFGDPTPQRQTRFVVNGRSERYTFPLV